MKWYESIENMRQLAQAIEDDQACCPQTSEFLEKPWKWNEEWKYFKKNNTMKGFDGY